MTDPTTPPPSSSRLPTRGQRHQAVIVRRELAEWKLTTACSACGAPIHAEGAERLAPGFTAVVTCASCGAAFTLEYQPVAASDAPDERR